MQPEPPQHVPTPTGIDGFLLWPGLLGRAAQEDLLAQVRERVARSPLYRPCTPGGRPLSVQMTNFGPLGWVSDKAGYRYQPTHPVMHTRWPDIPPMLLELWDRLTGWPQRPDACLVNLYQANAKMGLHQDKDEKDLRAPVLSVSLGDTGVFRVETGQGGTRSFRLASGDVCLLSGPARLARHGVDRVIAGSSRLLADGGRMNLTLRKAG